MQTPPRFPASDVCRTASEADFHLAPLIPRTRILTYLHQQPKLRVKELNAWLFLVTGRTLKLVLRRR